MATDIRYPIGKFAPKPQLTHEDRVQLIQQIADAPAQMRQAVRGLRDEHLDVPYRDGGWTIRQLVHHVPDSHMNAYIRFKLALTEKEPTIKPYDQGLWSELIDAKASPIEPSLTLLESLHQRWLILLRSMKDADFSKTYVHPESGPANLDRLLQLYAWHGRHHIAHITSHRQRMGW